MKKVFDRSILTSGGIEERVGKTGMASAEMVEEDFFIAGSSV